MMTREEAIVQIEGLKKYCEHMADSDESGAYVFDLDVQALDLALSVLRPVSREQELEAENKELKERIVNWRKYMTPTREQVEKVWRGEWIPVEDNAFYNRCSKCGKIAIGKHSFCRNCGAPMTDEAVQMVMERLEALKDADGRR